MNHLVRLNGPRTHRRTMHHSGFDQMINELFKTVNTEIAPVKESLKSYPKANIIEHDQEFVIEMAIPGISKKAVQVKLEQNVLSVFANAEKNEDSKQVKYYTKGFDYSNFERKFTLPKEVDVEQIHAAHKNGILTIRLQKRADLGPKEITIK